MGERVLSIHIYTSLLQSEYNTLKQFLAFYPRIQFHHRQKRTKTKYPRKNTNKITDQIHI